MFDQYPADLAEILSDGYFADQYGVLGGLPVRGSGQLPDRRVVMDVPAF